jgi:ABC-2 type transport system permease protein
MATVTSSLAPRIEGQASGQALSPRFPGLVRGELFKLSRQRVNWLLLLLLAGATSIYFVFLLGSPHIKDNILAAPLDSVAQVAERELAIIRIFIGIVLAIATARMIGLEYSLGTIRVVLARGAGRMQLLAAKLTAMAVAALVVLACCLVLAAALIAIDMALITGGLAPLQSLTAEFWGHTGLYLLTVLISIADTILMAAAVSVTLRSLAAGLGAALSWFPVDNILVQVLLLIAAFTQNDLWIKLPAYFLGPELNAMPALIVPKFNGSNVAAAGTQPLVVYDGTHTLLVAAIYGVVFLAVAFFLTWRRDVLE